jgi:hypothetical protein
MRALLNPKRVSQVPYVQVIIIGCRADRFARFASGAAKSGANIDLGVGEISEWNFQGCSPFQTFKVIQNPGHDVPVFSVAAGGNINASRSVELAHFLL